MARSRNIKPAFFSNEELGELEPIVRLSFIGLWTICDFKGCLEYRPKRIKAQILPYDNIDFEVIATSLDKSGFVRLYSVQGKQYLKILNFTKHQNPHKNEKAGGSDIPDIDANGSQVIDSITVTINPDKDGTTPADSLIPLTDSLNLIPLNKRLDQSAIDHIKKEKLEREKLLDELVEKFWLSGIRKIGKKISMQRLRSILAKQKDPEAFTDMLIADVKKRLELEQFGFAQLHPTTYLNGERWEDDYPASDADDNLSFDFEMDGFTPNAANTVNAGEGWAVPDIDAKPIAPSYQINPDIVKRELFEGVDS